MGMARSRSGRWCSRLRGATLGRMANVPKYNRAQKIARERKAGQMLAATSKSKSKVVRTAGLKASKALVNEAHKTVKAPKKPKPNLKANASAYKKRNKKALGS